MLQHLERGRCGSENNGNVVALRSGNREVSGGIAQTLLLLERMIVFFVNHDQPDVRHRRKDSGTRANDELRRAGPGAAPTRKAYPIRQVGVQDRWSYT